MLYGVLSVHLTEAHCVPSEGSNCFCKLVVRTHIDLASHTHPFHHYHHHTTLNRQTMMATCEDDHDADADNRDSRSKRMTAFSHDDGGDTSSKDTFT